jgi:hypothetical protein
VLANDAGLSGTVGCDDNDVVAEGADVVGSEGADADGRGDVAVAPARSQGFGGDTMFVWKERGGGAGIKCVALRVTLPR